MDALVGNKVRRAVVEHQVGDDRDLWCHVRVGQCTWRVPLSQ